VTRSVPRQERPYRSLKEVTRTQPTFVFRGVKGTLVGFRCPEYIGVVSVPGYHFHFLTADRKSGGHVLRLNLLNLQSARVRVDVTPRLVLDLPGDPGFYGADLRAETGSDLQEAEKGRADTPR
jgi:acetolactate decarboxylase